MPDGKSLHDIPGGGQSLDTLGICITTRQVQKCLGTLCPMGWELGFGIKRGKKDDPVTKLFHQKNNLGHQPFRWKHLVIVKQSRADPAHGHH